MFYIGYVTVKILRYIKNNNVNPLYLIINKVNRYFEESNGNEYLKLVRTDESNRTRRIIRSISNNADNYDEKYMKIKFSSDGDLPLKNTRSL